MNIKVRSGGDIIKNTNATIFPNKLFSFNWNNPNTHDQFIVHLGNNVKGFSVNGAIGFNIKSSVTCVESDCCCGDLGYVPFDTGNFSILFKIYSAGKQIYESNWTRSDAVITCATYDGKVENGTYFVMGLKQTIEVAEGYDVEDMSFSFELESAKNNGGESILDPNWPTIYMDADVHYQVDVLKV